MLIEQKRTYYPSEYPEVKDAFVLHMNLDEFDLLRDLCLMAQSSLKKNRLLREVITVMTQVVYTTTTIAEDTDDERFEDDDECHVSEKK